MSKPIKTVRAGGKYEAIGTLLIIGGLILLCASFGAQSRILLGAGIALPAIGLIIFLKGRFM